MSATAATTQQETQKAPRRSGRKPRPATDFDASLTPAASSAGQHERNPSPAAGNTTKNNNNKVQHRKAPQATNKPQQEVKHVHHQHEKGKATPTPMKSAAYAGSNFQQSPAASALPLPSFYSKSLPNTNLNPSRPAVPESVSPELTTDDPIVDFPSKREATPCDFLFQAARQARANSRADSPANRTGNLSVPNRSPASRSPAPREGEAMFPFELDGATPGEDGSSFATPYKDRIDALRSTSTGGKSMDDAERKAKTEALKKLLMKSSTQERNGNAGNAVLDVNNPFNARAPTIPQYFTQSRGSSNPSTPQYTQDNMGKYAPSNFIPAGYPFPTPQTQTPKRPNSSSLRHVYGAQNEHEYAELSSDSAVTPPSSSRKTTNHQPPPQYNTSHYMNHQQVPTHKAKPSAQQLEDDLRRVLKLDLVSRV